MPSYRTTGGRSSECCTEYVLASFTESSVTALALPISVFQNSNRRWSRTSLLRKHIKFDDSQKILATLLTR